MGAVGGGKSVATTGPRRVIRVAVMNIHHLELFYYVARYGGISAAVRHMPYGIQQPALSSQMLLLEEDLTVKLFERKPFRLTAEGQELLAFVEPFFSNLDAVGARMRKRLAPLLRIGGAELLLREHLPAVIAAVRGAHPEIRLALRSGFQAELEGWLANGQIDLALIPQRGRDPAGTQRLRLLRLPLVLLVPKKSKVKSAQELWAQKKVATPLISLPPTEIVSVLFRKGLDRLGVEWPPAIEASSLELITQYVVQGHGYGVTVAVGEGAHHAQVRALPLEGFDPLELVALWPGEPTPLIRAVLRETQRYIARHLPAAACDEVLK